MRASSAVVTPRAMSSRAVVFARWGAASYVIWSILHLQAAYAVYKLAAGVPVSMVQGRLLQDAWNLLAFSVTGAGTAMVLNWRNNTWGYWINAGIIGVADLGFVFFVLIPGHMPIWPGVVGPVFWLVGLILTTLGITGRGSTANDH
jgi:hypothetical protein